MQGDEALMEGIGVRDGVGGVCFDEGFHPGD